MAHAKLNLLIIGGSGFISGTLARLAVERGHHVHVVTRGARPLPEGVRAITCDRADRVAFARLVAAAGGPWDMVVDCIGYQPNDVRQDIDVLRDRARHLVFVSTDFVFDPAHRRFPQPEASAHYAIEGYGGAKRQCELVLLADAGDMAWTVVRPCHVYGPGSWLGCLPAHGRDPDLVDRLRRAEALRLVGGGHFLQQPIFAPDLAELILSFHGNDRTYGRVFCAAGPDVVESRTYYDLVAQCLGLDPPRIEELPVGTCRAAHPDKAPFLCHRVYSLEALRACGAAVPGTPLAEGLRRHVASLVGA